LAFPLYQQVFGILERRGFMADIKDTSPNRVLGAAILLVAIQNRHILRLKGVLLMKLVPVELPRAKLVVRCRRLRLAQPMVILVSRVLRSVAFGYVERVVIKVSRIVLQALSFRLHTRPLFHAFPELAQPAQQGLVGEGVIGLEEFERAS
jgi:hypothetical protein